MLCVPLSLSSSSSFIQNRHHRRQLQQLKQRQFEDGRYKWNVVSRMCRSYVNFVFFFFVWATAASPFTNKFRRLISSTTLTIHKLLQFTSPPPPPPTFFSYELLPKRFSSWLQCQEFHSTDTHTHPLSAFFCCFPSSLSLLCVFISTDYKRRASSRASRRGKRGRIHKSEA